MANLLKQSIRMATRDLNTGLATALIKEAKRQLDLRYPKKLYGKKVKPAIRKDQGQLRATKKQEILLKIGKVAVMRVNAFGKPLKKGDTKRLGKARHKLVELVRKYNELSR